jgi:hypothetical protein
VKLRLQREHNFDKQIAGLNNPALNIKNVFREFVKARLWKIQRGNTFQKTISWRN